MYELDFSKRASKYIKKQDKLSRTRIKNSLLTLAENPYDDTLNNIRRIEGRSDLFRLRVGDLRVIYKIIDEKLLIFIEDINSRGDIYKRL